jgi:hypothetical protein
VTEWKLFDGDVPHVSTAEFHRDRPRAPHLDQPSHWPRLHVAGQYIRATAAAGSTTLSDLGCGDGGLLSIVQDAFSGGAWGYDFSPANAAGWAERHVIAYQLDVFGDRWHRVTLGSTVVMTEVLEHLADPHGTLRRVHEGGADHLVCSSPVNENADNHDECHAWAWNMRGYAAMIANAGWSIAEHEVVDPFQVVRAVR